jgi:phosphate transport system permease protein
MLDLYARRRHRNTIVLVLSVGATAVGLGWLVMILGSLVYEGFSGLSLAVFTEMTPPPGAAGGLLNPIMGSLMLTVLAVVIGTPIGMLAGTYMAEYGKYARITALNNQFFSTDLNAPISSLPVVIFQFALSPYADWQRLAWIGALIITFAVLALIITARALAGSRKSP